VTQIFCKCSSNRVGDSKTFEFGSVISLFAATVYQGNHDVNYKLGNIASTEIYALYNLC